MFDNRINLIGAISYSYINPLIPYTDNLLKVLLFTTSKSFGKSDLRLKPGARSRQTFWVCDTLEPSEYYATILHGWLKLVRGLHSFLSLSISFNCMIVHGPVFANPWLKYYNFHLINISICSINFFLINWSRPKLKQNNPNLSGCRLHQLEL